MENIFIKNKNTKDKAEEKLVSLLKEIPKYININIPEDDKKKFNISTNNYSLLSENIKERSKSEKNSIMNYFIDKIISTTEYIKDKEWKLPQGLSKEKQEKIKLIIKELEGVKGDKNRFLGKGNVGSIYKTIRDNEKSCIKWFTGIDSKYLKNTLNQEYELHKRINICCVDNSLTLKVPNPESIIINNFNQNKSFFIMQTVDGYSIKDIENNGDLLIKLFDSDKNKIKLLFEKLKDKDFIEKLKKDLKFIHQNTGIIHGDIHHGNLMFSKNLDIYLIDFGNSIDTNLVKVTDKDYEKVENIKDQDLNALENLIKLLVIEVKNILDNDL